MTRQASSDVPVIVAIALYAVGLFSPFALRGSFWTYDVAVPREPPWCDIGDAFVTGVSSAVAALILLAFTLVYRARDSRTAWFGFAFGFLWMGPRIGDLIVILAKTRRIWDPVTAESAWPTAAAFRGDPSRYLAMVLAVALAVWLLRRHRPASAS